MPRITHFEIHAEDPQRAIEFYATVLGWTFSRWKETDYWIITTGPGSEPGINGGLLPRRGPVDGTAVTAYVCTANVEDLDARLAVALSSGGTVALPKMPIPGIGWLAYVKDTESNIFGMMQSDSAAA